MTTARKSRGLCYSRTENRWVIVTREGSHVRFYRAVMEAHLGRHLRSDEIVHHINGDSADDRLGNLQLVTNSEHQKLHRAEHLTRNLLSQDELDRTLALRDEGLSYRAIGERLGITAMAAWHRVNSSPHREGRRVAA